MDFQRQQQQQQQPQMMMRPVNLTTEQIQKYLEENEELILAILESHNLGKLAERALYQRQLQENLTYLAGIADSQQQAAAASSQILTQPTSKLDDYTRPCPAAISQQQLGSFNPNMSSQSIRGQIYAEPEAGHNSAVGGLQARQESSNFMNMHICGQEGIGHCSLYGGGYFAESNDRTWISE